MENKILLSDIQKKDKYKAIIEVNNIDDYVYIENPYGEKFKELFEKIQNYITYDDEEYSAINIYNWMFKNLTNIEFDEELKDLDEIDENSTLIEVIFHLKEIFDRIENTIWMNLISLYSDSKKEKYKKTFIEEFENAIKENESDD